MYSGYGNNQGQGPPPPVYPSHGYPTQPGQYPPHGQPYMASPQQQPYHPPPYPHPQGGAQYPGAPQQYPGAPHPYQQYPGAPQQYPGAAQPYPGAAQPYPGAGPYSGVPQGAFDSGARFDNGAPRNIPPPPPGVQPNAAQLAAARGQQVNVGQKKGDFWEGDGSDSGFVLF